jgi:hypothetical protein
MEGSQMPAPAAARSEAGTVRATQIGLIVASLGAFLVIFNLFGLGIVGLFLAVGGAALAASGGVGKGWYAAVALGAIVAVLSRLVAEGAETIGGWLAVAGSMAILIATALGFPVRGERDSG